MCPTTSFTEIPKAVTEPRRVAEQTTANQKPRTVRQVMEIAWRRNRYKHIEPAQGSALYPVSGRVEALRTGAFDLVVASTARKGRVRGVALQEN